MKLMMNALLDWLSQGDVPRVDRVLWIDPAGADVVTINIFDKRAFPVWRKCEELEEALARNDCRVLEVDPYAALLLPEDVIRKEHRERRDKAWAVIAPMVDDSENDRIFNPRERGRLIAATVERTGRTKATIYKYLRRYWQGGQVKNALLPRFEQCGGKEKERCTGGRKRGRPSELARATGQSLGVNVDAGIRERFSRGIKLFYENRQGRTLRDAYQLTLERFFHKGYENQDGMPVPYLPPADELPSFAQFRYWYEKERDITRSITSRAGRREFNLRHRAVLGDSTRMAFGPGSIYQIDATIGDVYLVSSLDRTRIIGRPVVYVVIDVFSRLIAGIGVGLEGPSWLGAMLALENATANKVAFCREYGVTISEEEWPCRHLPEAILADRGELVGYNADNLVNALNVRVVNTPPYRADWKAIVERQFRLINDKMIHSLPGAVRGPRKRGERDHRLGATLDLNQFMKLMIYCVLDHNNQHRMDWYPVDEFLTQDKVDPYPIDLWNWGIKNRAGHLRTMSQDVIRLNLLPGGEASVTERGIRFQGLVYTSEIAIREQWFVKARERGRWRVDVAYDPRRVEVIYLRLDGGRRMEPCRLLDSQSASTFRGRAWREILEHQKVQKQASEAARTRGQQARAQFHAQAEQVIAEAKRQTNEATKKQSNSARIKGIRANRQVELTVERAASAWRLEEKQNLGPVRVVPIRPADKPAGDSEEYVPPYPPDLIDELRRSREKVWQKQEGKEGNE